MTSLRKILIGVRQSQVVPADSDNSNFAEKIMKYIPGSILAAWTALLGVLNQATDALPVWFDWTIFGVMLCLTPFYVCYLKTAPAGFSAKKLLHIFIACLAFATGVFATGGIPFGSQPWFKPVYGSVLIIIVTLLIPILERFFGGPPVNPPSSDPSGPVEPPTGQGTTKP